jgi:hypothetical protein
MTDNKEPHSNPTGYASSAYANSLSEFGSPFQLPRSKGWLLKRQISGFSFHDAMWTYPLLSCSNWQELHLDLDELQGQLISISAVTDPFGEYDLAYLHTCFKDVALPFKQHFVIDLGHPLESFVAPHHLRNAKKALRELTVEQCVDVEECLDDWVGLYSNLIERHHIKGLVAFSRNSFAAQLKTPGMIAFRAINNGETVGMLLWYIQNKIGYYHLGAYSPRGYKLGASFALFWVAIQHFTTIGLQWLNIGAGAGANNESSDGLTRFKKGWSTGTKTAYFCGRILDYQKYQEISQAKQVCATSFFPTYRFGEF